MSREVSGGGSCRGGNVPEFRARSAAITAPASDQDPTEADVELERQKKIDRAVPHRARKEPAAGHGARPHLRLPRRERHARRARRRAIGSGPKRTERRPAWMILGLLESQRGRDAAAVEAFDEGRSRDRRQPDGALLPGPVAGARRPARRGGRGVRAGDRAQAGAGRPAGDLPGPRAGSTSGPARRRGAGRLDRLEKLFPDDPRVQEQIAATLVEEGQLPRPCRGTRRWPSRPRTTTASAVYRMEAADLKVRLGKSADGVADFEKLLGGAQPRKLALPRGPPQDRRGLSSHRRPGRALAKYYERWVGGTRRGRRGDGPAGAALAAQARVPEAQEWLEKALQARPVAEGAAAGASSSSSWTTSGIAEAIEQYELLDKADPNNPDHPPRLGQADPPRHGAAQSRSGRTRRRQSGGG